MNTREQLEAHLLENSEDHQAHMVLAVFLDHPGAFAHLKKLTLEDNYLPLELFPQVKAHFKGVLEFGEQRDDGGDPEDRYASAVE